MGDPVNPEDKFDWADFKRGWGADDGEDDEDSLQMPRETNLKTFIEQARRLLDKLPQEEAQLLRDRFGLEDGRSRSIEEVATAKNLTPAQVEEMERVALVKLKGG